MKFELFGETGKPEPTVKLKLVKFGTGAEVIAIDEEGKRVACGALVTFNQNGTILRNPGVSHKLGFELDDSGSIQDTIH